METVQHKKKKEQVIDFSRLWAALVRRKTTYFKVIPTVILTVWVITLGLPDYYKCKIQLVPESGSGGGASTLALLASSFGVNLGSGSSGNDAITAFLYPDVMSSVEFKADVFFGSHSVCIPLRFSMCPFSSKRSKLNATISA